MEAPPGPVVPAGQDHGRACTIALGITVLLMAICGAVLAIAGIPQDTTTAPALLVATFGGFACLGGQAAMITGFMAMKQRQNAVWVVPAVLGAVLGVAAVLGIMGLFIYVGAVKAGLRF